MLETIDWHRPWLAPFLPVVEAASAGGDWRAVFNALSNAKAIHNHAGLPLRFVDQGALPPDVPYETFISETGGVPTRPNLHDFFNAMVWLSYPHAKAQLNALQASEITRRFASISVTGSGKAERATRGTLRDRATIFDENAALLLTCEPTVALALRAHHWQESLLQHRADFGTTCEVMLFGHALIEKLVTPYKAITAHVWVLQVATDFFDLPVGDKQAAVDSILGKRLADGLLKEAPTPLPVLGVPGWWEGQDAHFYADTAVFRPKRPS